jgi:hypothetical protein
MTRAKLGHDPDASCHSPQIARCNVVASPHVLTQLEQLTQITPQKLFKIPSYYVLIFLTTYTTILPIVQGGEMKTIGLLILFFGCGTLLFTWINRSTGVNFLGGDYDFYVPAGIALFGLLISVLAPGDPSQRGL